MDILYVILTALLVVAAVTMILKKVDTRLTFLFLGRIPFYKIFNSSYNAMLINGKNHRQCMAGHF